MAESNTKKDLALIGGLFLLLLGLLFFGRSFTSLNFAPAGSESAGLSPIKSSNKLTSGQFIDVKINDFTIKAKVASTSRDRQKGLSDMESLPFDEGMLFVFEKDDIYKIWMKDMKFAIDIIWIDKNKNIIDIETNIAPEPDTKDEDLTVYEPESNSRYILEINAGLVNENNIAVGDTVVIGEQAKDSPIPEEEEEEEEEESKTNLSPF